MTTFVLLILLKTGTFGLSALLYNSMAAFSGVGYLDDTLIVTFFVSVTYYGFYNWSEKQVSFASYRQDESKLPFKMSELYQYHRDKAIGNLTRNFGIFTLMAWYCGAICVTVSFYCYGGQPNHDGMTRDVWGVGLLIWLL